MERWGFSDRRQVYCLVSREVCMSVRVSVCESVIVIVSVHVCECACVCM